MVRERSTSRLRTATPISDVLTPEHMKRAISDGVATLDWESKFLPVAGVACWWMTFGATLGTNIYYGHDRGTNYWLPYISDCGKFAPERGLFSFGATMTSMFMMAVCLLNYGRVKYLLKDQPEGNRCRKRNVVACLTGFLGSPFLGLLACLDTHETPRAHLVCALVFFHLIAVFAYTNLHMYNALLSSNLALRTSDEQTRKLARSVRLKTLILIVMTVAILLYLPVGLYFTENWDATNDSRDVLTHSFRACFQHIAVAMIVLYFFTFYWDFGDKRAAVVSFEEPHPLRR